jgi:hypothetical protein
MLDPERSIELAERGGVQAVLQAMRAKPPIGSEYVLDLGLQVLREMVRARSANAAELAESQGCVGMAAEVLGNRDWANAEALHGQAARLLRLACAALPGAVLSPGAGGAAALLLTKSLDPTALPEVRRICQGAVAALQASPLYAERVRDVVVTLRLAPPPGESESESSRCAAPGDHGETAPAAGVCARYTRIRVSFSGHGPLMRKRGRSRSPK